MKRSNKSQDMTEEALAFSKAVDLLAIRMHSSQELSRKLLLRKFSKEVVLNVITRLTDLRYLNDEEFARVYMESLIRSKTYGYYGIRAKLMQRGVDREVTDITLSNLLDEETEVKLAKKLLRKKHFLDKQKLMMSLKQKGFRSSVIMVVLSGINAEE